jgi:hypothetical protein
MTTISILPLHYFHKDALHVAEWKGQGFIKTSVIGPRTDNLYRPQWRHPDAAFPIGRSCRVGITWKRGLKWLY